MKHRLVVAMVFAFIGYAVSVSSADAATYTVTKTADTNDGTCDADCSFREALAVAESNIGSDLIRFNIPTTDPGYNTPNYPGSFVITPLTRFENINDSVTIDGNTQTIFSGDSNVAVTENKNSSASGTPTTGPEIIFNFESITQSWAFSIYAPSVVFDRLGFYNNPANRGRPIRPYDNLGDGLTITNSTFVNNQFGAFIANDLGDDYVFENNVFLNTSGQPVVEFKANGARVIGNTFVNYANWGVYHFGDSTKPITINDNIFKLGGNEGSDIGIAGNSDYLVENNAFYSRSGTTGVIEVTGTGSKARIKNNLFIGNMGISIDLHGGMESFGIITPNDPGDLDTGPNDLMNYPEIRHANHLGDGRYAIGGIIDGNLSEAPFTIELCRSSNHPSGHGGCIETLATTTTTGTDWEVFVSTSITNPEELSLSALATNSRGSTSEFSRTVTAKTATPSSLPLPLVPDVVPGTGASITKDSVVAVAESHTFNYDAYLSTITTSQTAPYRLPGTLYFQASPIQEIWWKAHANDAKILDSEVNTGYIIALKYQPSSLDPNLNPRHLRLAYRPDSTSSWKVLYNSVHDPINYTVATVTKTGGEYMLVSRW